MTNKVITYGLMKDQQEMLQAVLPEGYTLSHAESATDLIVTSALCYIISQAGIAGKEVSLLKNYCRETVGYANERVFWIGDAVPCEGIVAYECFLTFIMDLPQVLEKASEYFETQNMYCSEYAVLPTRAIADALEQEFCGALERKFSVCPAPAILERVRREWFAVQEIAAAPELAAVHELCSWLRRNNKPYYMEGSATSGFIPYLLDIIKVNPLPMTYAGNDAVFQDFCSYGNYPTYIFHLPKEMEKQIVRWQENHWLKELYPTQWESMQARYPNRLTRLNMQFEFDLEDITDPEIPELCCEDVYYYLLKHDHIEKDAFRGMCRVREGRGLLLVTEEMQAAEDSYLIECFQNAEYLPKRSDLMEQKVMAIRLKDRRKTNGTTANII